MSALVATDLDGTLVYSRRTAGPGDPAAWRAVECRDGVATGWTTHRASAILELLARRATWVPATTRTVAQFRRLRLPATRWAVCAHGGVLLDRGVADPAWAAHVGELVARVAPPEAVTAALARHTGEVVGPLRVADGLFLTTTLDEARLPDGWVDDLAARCTDLGWTAHVSARKLHLLPRGLSKAVAVTGLRRRIGGGALLAAGDSALDADLLRAADAAIRPAHGELHDLGWHADHLTVTAGAGVTAGEEIAAWLLPRLVADGHLPPEAATGTA